MSFFFGRKEFCVGEGVEQKRPMASQIRKEYAIEMTDYINQDCPLCDSPADYCWVAGHMYMHYGCPQCTSFLITRSAERRLKISPERKDHYSQLAQQAADDELLVIQMSDQDRHKHSGDDLQADILKKSELNLSCI